MDTQKHTKNLKELSDALNQVFELKDDGVNLRFEKNMINTDAMHIVLSLMKTNGGITQAEWADKLNVSPSYISQLFAGDKKFNLTLLAKLQRIFNVTFKVVTSDMVINNIDDVGGKIIYLPTVPKEVKVDYHNIKHSSLAS